MISGSLAFLMGVATNEGLMYMRRHWPKQVRWNTAEVQRDYTMPLGLPPTNLTVETGIAEDGSMVWRVRRDN
jgi:hypothetical protein